MSDIMMCNGTNCVVKDKCKRFTSKPNEQWQSYFSEPPFEVKDDVFTCDFFWGEQNDNIMSYLKDIVK
jgi:hypothetical protein